jgi:hypothetical protein
MENVSTFIDKVRDDIKIFAEKLYYNDEDTKNFEQFFNCKDYTEDLLKIHEDLLDDLQLKYNENQVLYEKSAKWLSLWQQFSTFSEQTKDPNRFKQRGFNGAEEEKTRKQYKSQFLKLEDEIEKKAQDYKTRNNGNVFMIKGVEWNLHFDTLRQKCDKSKLVDNKNASVPSKLLQKGCIKRKTNDMTITTSPAAGAAARRQLWNNGDGSTRKTLQPANRQIQRNNATPLTTGDESGKKPKLTIKKQ